MTLPKIIIDSRELHSGVPKLLDKIADIRIEEMSVGDYCVSARCGIERKTTDDFLKSWLDDKKLFGQLHDLKNSYELPILLIEGDEMSLYTERRVDPRAVQGCLFAIARMRIPTLYTLHASGTAYALYWYASKEQDTAEKRHFSQHGKRSHMTDSEIKEYIVSAIPDLGTLTARNLLNHFGSIKSIVNAEKEQLMEVENVGKKTAEKIRQIVDGKYVA